MGTACDMTLQRYKYKYLGGERLRGVRDLLLRLMGVLLPLLDDDLERDPRVGDLLRACVSLDRERLDCFLLWTDELLGLFDLELS